MKRPWFRGGQGRGLKYGASRKDRYNFLRFVRSLTNDELVDELKSAAAGDDYDGCFTPYGFWQYDVLQKELEIRLGNWMRGKKRHRLNIK